MQRRSVGIGQKMRRGCEQEDGTNKNIVSIIVRLGGKCAKVRNLGFCAKVEAQGSDVEAGVDVAKSACVVYNAARGNALK